MGVVYKAYDTVIKRQVAVKTLHDIRDPAALDLFYKEWGVLASLVHPNIVQVYDIGGFESDGETVPFFVMPLLPGVTLSKLIYDKSHRLTAERAVDIIHQACRGIQAAHDAKLVHRDIKPSNILVLDDDSVKIIDFGVAHLVGKEGSTGLKGTPFYMAPEQIRMQRPSALTDVYSLGVVAYEALTGRRPIGGSTDAEIAEAILSHIPPAASEINPALNQLMSRVLHKAMAKHPWHRFSSAREFGDALLKAVRNEPIEIFDPARVQPRIDRAQRAFEGGDFGFASEVLAELEGEGCLDPQITLLRRKLAEVQRKSRIQTLIEGARRCLDEQEHTLALRKVQEALDLDPHDGDVLLLKARIEEASRSRKIDDWMRLAERHLGNSAFAHARQALQSVLDAQPGQPDAERLLAQVNERENEHVRAQEQKAKLHQQAVAAWEKGEISSALSKLDRLLKLDREAPGTDAERVAEYQRFYQQVRSEHEAINNAYSEARALLEQGEFRRALEICDLHLKKYPGHALFRALKLDIEDRQSCSLSSYIAEVDQRLASEPDLDKRVSLLQEALQRYPAEAHFERALRQAKQRRELLHSIVARARQLEESGHFSEAIEQWKVLQSIDSSYPGVEIEIERLVARRDQQARGEAKAEWVQRAERELEAGEAARAVKTCARALEEFPDDPELAQVAESARQAVERSSRAYELSQQAQQHFEGQEFEKGIGKLREATELDPRNPEFRVLLGKSLLEQARTLISSDWRAAEQLVEEAAGLAPDHALTGSLRTLIHDSKREEAVSWCLAKARQLQGEGKAGEACQLVERVLETYPGVSRLERLLDTLRPLATASGSDTARARALDELQRIAQQAERTGGEAITRGLAARVEEIERSWPGDPEVGATAAEAQRKLREFGTPPEGVPALPAKPPARAAEAGGGEPQTRAPEALAGGTAAAGKPGTFGETPGSGAPMREAPAASSPAKGKSKPGTRAPASQRPSAAPPVPKQAGAPHAWLASAMTALRQGGARNMYLWLAASALLALVLVVLAVAWFNRTPPAPPVALAEVRLSVEPAGAKVTLSGGGETFECVTPDCVLNVPAGEYALTANLAGYRPWRETVSIEAGSPVPVARNLEPLPVLLRLISDLQRATVRVAGQEIEDPLEEGFLELSLSPGVYPVEVSSGSMAASLMVDVAPGRAPRFAEAIEAREFQIYAVASFGGSAELRSTAQAVEVQVDGQQSGAASEGVLQLAGLTAGLHELTFTTGEGQIRRSFEIGEEPALTAVLITDRNLGSVIVGAGVEGAEVVINDGRYRRETGNNGRVRLWLAPGEYTAVVAKDGHEPAAPQAFTIRKGDETRLDFELPPLPQMARLEMSGAPAGAEVWLDDKRLGQIGRDGTFETSVPAGPHRVELRNLPEMYQPLPAEKEFSQGATVALEAGDLPLRAVKGRVQIQVEPADAGATVTIQQGGGPEQAIQPGTYYRDPGDYVVSASAPGYEGSQSGQRVVVGQTTVFHLTLRGETRRVPQRRLGLADLGKIGGFENVDGVMVRNGGEFVLLPASPATGSYTFTANVRGGSLFRHVGIGGRARIQWVIDYADDGNYALYEFGENALLRTLVSGGKRGTTDRIAHDCPKADYYSISVDVSPTTVTQKALCGGQWAVLETWQAEGANLADGKFGFFVPNNSTLAISHFEAVGP